MTPLMKQILHALDSGEVMTPNEIGYAIKAAPVHGGRGQGGRGKGPRAFGAAQRIIFPLTRLYDLGYVAAARRRDGQSGTAYRITPAGREARDA